MALGRGSGRDPGPPEARRVKDGGIQQPLAPSCGFRALIYLPDLSLGLDSSASQDSYAQLTFVFMWLLVTPGLLQNIAGFSSSS